VLVIAPLNSRIGGKVVLQETLLPIVDKNKPTTECNFSFVRHFFFEQFYSYFSQKFLAMYRLDATLLFARKARFLDPVGLEVAGGKRCPV